MDRTNTTSRLERRDAAENRQRILNVASKLFELHGVERISMNQIASEAQIGAGTLYRRYRNKSELCMDLIKDNAALFFKDVEIYLLENGNRPPSERLRGLLTLFIKFREKNADLLLGIENEVYQGSESRTSSPLYEQLHQQLFELFEEMATESEESQAISLFKTDMLLTAMSNDSYLFQKNVRGNSPERIVEQLCLTFL
ncbi:TetR/AcrR family transcriptional regulator [Paenibacillus sp. FSL K6-0108]|uniref:TetR/AcrR family transcriptional regulator n=1 Tax=Paenibacillus sp. FSL K6-0108 TaxID=2921417 RepID=UPI003252F684